MMPPPRPTTADREGRFDRLAQSLTGPVLAVCDAKVLRLHPHVGKALAKLGAVVVPLKAGEGAKTLATVARIARKALTLPRSTTVLAVGGGTIGDVATVAAHLHKRGARLVQVPTTLLAAVDSSLGGKGAVNVGEVKNALGVFHFPAEGWLCRELWTTLPEPLRREGRLEAWKMAAALDARLFFSWARQAPDDDTLVARSRALKTAVCQLDPLETAGLRTVLNFGHTLGHVLESLSDFRVRHGDAVGLGMLCALDVGWRLGVTPADTKARVEAALPLPVRPRATLRRVLSRRPLPAVRALLEADKKGARQMILLERPGQWVQREVPAGVLDACLRAWREQGRA